jgi:ABC-type sugar transport system permease subunit
LFLTLIGIHILAALVCLVAAILAMFTKKTGKRHPKFGTLYFRSLAVVLMTSIFVSILRWPLDNHLLILGIFSFAFAYTGRLFQRNKWKNRMQWHLVCMSLSFI